MYLTILLGILLSGRRKAFQPLDRNALLAKNTDNTVISLFLNFLHQRNAVLKACLISSPHLGGGGIAHAVEYLVKHIDLLLAQRVFKRNTQLVKLVRELSGVNIPHTEVVNHINHCKHPFGYFLACCTSLTMFV